MVASTPVSVSFVAGRSGLSVCHIERCVQQPGGSFDSRRVHGPARQRREQCRRTRLQHRTNLGVSENVELVAANAFEHLLADFVPVRRGDEDGRALRATCPGGNSGTRPVAASRCGRTAAVLSNSSDFTGPGHSTDTPIPCGRRSARSDSASPTSAYLVVAYTPEPPLVIEPGDRRRDDDVPRQLHAQPSAVRPCARR